MVLKHVTYGTTVRLLFMRTLMLYLVAGCFLPFFHLSTAEHLHYYNPATNNFFDIVQSSSSVQELNSSTRKSQSGKNSINYESQLKTTFSYCLSANGTLLNPFASVKQWSQTARLYYSLVTHEFLAVTHCSLSILSYAPKVSPPIS